MTRVYEHCCALNTLLFGHVACIVLIPLPRCRHVVLLHILKRSSEDGVLFRARLYERRAVVKPKSTATSVRHCGVPRVPYVKSEENIKVYVPLDNFSSGLKKYPFEDVCEHIQ